MHGPYQKLLRTRANTLAICNCGFAGRDASSDFWQSTAAATVVAHLDLLQGKVVADALAGASTEGQPGAQVG